jgi:DNA repair exonuclease SbcCD ATPase subunit
MVLLLISLWLPFFLSPITGFSTISSSSLSSPSHAVVPMRPQSTRIRRVPLSTSRSVDGDTTTTTSSSRSIRSHNAVLGNSNSKLRMTTSSDEVEFDDIIQPRPPNYPPRVDEQLEDDLREAERRVMLYAKEVELVREQLDMKQDELMEERNIFRDEKYNLVSRIVEFTKLLAQRDEELAIATQAPPQATIDPEREAALLDEIKSLKDELLAKVDALQKEQSSTAELRKRFEETQDALEFEQMNFEKERKSLQMVVANERTQLKELESKFEKSKTAFETTRQELINRISVEEQKLNDTKAKWKTTQEELQQVEEKLQAAYEEKTQFLKDGDRKLAEDRARLGEEKNSLQEQIRSEQARLEEARKELEEERSKYTESKNRIELLVQVEEKKVDGLQKELAKEQKKYESEKVGLDKKINEISLTLSSVEKELANERVNFSNEKKKLEQKLEDEYRVGKLKKRQMKERYDQIRAEMTNLWESSKRQARQEENRLKKKYEKRIDSVDAQLSKLQNDFDKSEKSQQDMKTMLDAMSQEKERMQLEFTAMELKYSGELQQRDATIASLEGSVQTLRQSIADKDKIIQQKQAQIEGYETSMRQVFKLGFVVTGNKIKGVGRPLKRLIQNSPPPDV